MRRYMALMWVLGTILVGCASPIAPAARAPGQDVPFPPTWTPTATVGDTPTATLVVIPTPTWDGTPPPPSEAEVPRFLPGQLYRALEKEKEITVVDVRNLAAYKQARISGALHIPFEELSERAGELDRNKMIVFYDLSPNEAVSLKAAMFLYELGFTKVAVLDGGLQKWYSDGYPIEGTLLTPTPASVGPPWTVTPLPTSTLWATAVKTPTLTLEAGTITPTATKAQ